MCIKLNCVLWIKVANEILLQMHTSHLQCSSPVLFDMWGGGGVNNNIVLYLIMLIILKARAVIKEYTTIWKEKKVSNNS